MECSDLCLAETARLQFCAIFRFGRWCGPVGAAVVICVSISGLVVEYIVAIDVTRVRFPADAFALLLRDDLPMETLLVKSAAI